VQRFRVATVERVSARWSVEQVESIAPSAAAISAAQSLANPTKWTGLGADDQALWGSCQGGSAEPYDTAVDHVGVGFRCTCPSRKVPCKHAIALLLMWVRELVPIGTPTPKVESWTARRANRAAVAVVDQSGPSGDSTTGESTTDAALSQESWNDSESRSDSDDPKVASTAHTSQGVSGGSTAPGATDSSLDGGVPPESDGRDDRDTARDERVERMMAGLTELDRWLDDRIRTGLADPALARYATWDDLAARLVDAQAGSLANRIRRLAGLVGASPNWHDEVLGELGLLHLLAQAGRRLGSLPDPLADAVATTVGWQVRHADVLGGVPDTDHWVVAGRSDQREDRIEVRRLWLRGVRSGRWALVLSFAAYRQSLDSSLSVGTTVHADLHRYPGPALRALVGIRHPDPAEVIFPGAASMPAIGRPPGQTLADACDEVGRMLVGEPWLDRVPTSATASLGQRGDRWYLTDQTGSLALLDPAGQVASSMHRRRALPDDGLAMLLALSQGHPVDLTLEWTPHGVTPLAVHLDDHSVDIGPRADSSFVGAA
jgi:SWIM zinc finger